MNVPEPADARPATTSRALCYTAPMFIHRISITGCSDRGAWPWRDSPALPLRLMPHAR
jgi:hypothetical protein